MFRRLAPLAVLLMMLSVPLKAGPLEELERYFFSVNSLEGRFVQETRDEDGRVIERSEGTLALERPNRFHWEYEQPFEQDLIADGERLWVYDRDLAQVSVRPVEVVYVFGFVMSRPPPSGAGRRRCGEGARRKSRSALDRETPAR